jgi:hypothetical protein
MKEQRQTSVVAGSLERPDGVFTTGIQSVERDHSLVLGHIDGPDSLVTEWQSIVGNTLHLHSEISDGPRRRGLLQQSSGRGYDVSVIE